MRIGWVAAGTLAGREATFRRLAPPVAMRIANTARWIAANSPHRTEMYRPGRRYDVVVFFKAMDARCQEEARRVQESGGRVVFDANVNYYEIRGDYEIPATRPTERQQADATAMTRLADHVVADSTYLRGVVRALNERVDVVPDNVDLRLFGGRRLPLRRRRARLIWSGVAQKGLPLLDLVPVLAELRDTELLLVSDRPPDVLPALREAIPTRYVRFGLLRYALLLRASDVILSPKRLVNAYELGHTEWKITLGMACGLPAVASPQQSYVEAIEHLGGGRVAGSQEDWRRALAELTRDPRRREELGARARRTVRERYALPVVARRYLDVLEGLA